MMSYSRQRCVSRFCLPLRLGAHTQRLEEAPFQRFQQHPSAVGSWLPVRKFTDASPSLSHHSAVKLAVHARFPYISQTPVYMSSHKHGAIRMTGIQIAQICTQTCALRRITEPPRNKASEKTVSSRFAVAHGQSFPRPRPKNATTYAALYSILITLVSIVPPATAGSPTRLL
jgi:hypothetical protein